MKPRFSKWLLKWSGAAVCMMVVLASPAWLLAQMEGNPAEQLVDRVHNAVVFLLADNQRAAAAGSGFALDPSGLVVTNFHVLEEKEKGKAEGMCPLIREDPNTEIRVGVENGPNLGEPQVVAYDQARDLVILRLPHKPGATVTLGDSSQLHVAQPVWALGFPHSLPLGFNLIFTQGDVAGMRTIDQLVYIQHTASVAPGSSGGPLFNTAGAVVGVNDAVGLGPGNENWAIPSNDVRELLTKTREPVPLRQFCAALPGQSQNPEPGGQPTVNPTLIFQSQPFCLRPGHRDEYTATLHAGRTFVLILRRLSGEGTLAFGIGSSQQDFVGTAQEDADGRLAVEFAPPHTGTYQVIIGVAKGGHESTCSQLFVFGVDQDGN